MDKYVKVPLSDEDARSLKSGDYVYLTGTIYTARDAAHKRMQEVLDRGETLPIGMKNNVIYYMGPSPAREGRPIGSAGPTTASRMDKYAPGLLDLGLKGMIGKGKRSQAVRDAIVRNGAVYFAAVGGAGALLSRTITSSEVIAYDDLGTEAIRKLTVKDFPAIVVIDAEGNNLVGFLLNTGKFVRTLDVFPVRDGNNHIIDITSLQCGNGGSVILNHVPGDSLDLRLTAMIIFKSYCTPRCHGVIIFFLPHIRARTSFVGNLTKIIALLGNFFLGENFHLVHHMTNG